MGEHEEQIEKKEPKGVYGITHVISQDELTVYWKDDYSNVFHPKDYQNEYHVRFYIFDIPYQVYTIVLIKYVNKPNTEATMKVSEITGLWDKSLLGKKIKVEIQSRFPQEEYTNTFIDTEYYIDP